MSEEDDEDEYLVWLTPYNAWLDAQIAAAVFQLRADSVGRLRENPPPAGWVERSRYGAYAEEQLGYALGLGISVRPIFDADPLTPDPEPKDEP